ncbi:hypothetical protein ABPG77_000642 [Micractinium sp. CCAP 211/92]
MARWVIAREDEEAEEPSSSEEEESDVEEEEEEEEEQAASGEGAEPADADGDTAAGAAAPGSTIKSRKLSIKLGGPDVCHVCGQRGHIAGFVGAKYIDCPNKPCYLCGQRGHSTMTCPFRVAPGHGCTHAAGLSNDTLLSALRQRERGGRPPPPQAPSASRWQVDAAVLKLHSRRTTCLEFHPTLDHLVLSGDKKGQIAVWDWQKVYERTVFTSINRWLTNQLRFMPGGDGSSCASSSYDGSIKIFDVETGCATTAFDANPGGWDQDDPGQLAAWITMMGMDVIPAANVVVAGDNFGRLHFVDPRMSMPVASLTVHKKKGSKIQSVHVNPVDSNLVMSAGNDYTARILDIRSLTTGKLGKAPVGAAPEGAPAELAVLQHSKVINSAYFSPITGRKIMTTSQDNRIRVWDYLYSTAQPADREIVHSQNFNRYLTPFRAEWDPKDPAERLVVCGRYISEDFGGVALHPVDLLDAATGALVGELVDPNLTTICPVNKPHPRVDLIVSGSSRSLYAWRPAPAEEEEEDPEGEGSSGKRRGGGGGGGGGDGGGPSRPRGSAHFISFDADPEKKGGKRSKAAAPAALAADEPSPSAGSKGKGKGKASAAAEEEEDEEDEEEGQEEPGPSTGRKRGGSASGKAAPKRQRKRQGEGGKG